MVDILYCIYGEDVTLALPTTHISSFAYVDASIIQLYCISGVDGHIIDRACVADDDVLLFKTHRSVDVNTSIIYQNTRGNRAESLVWIPVE